MQDVSGGTQLWTGNVCACHASCAAQVVVSFSLARSSICSTPPMLTTGMALADDGVTGVAITYNGYIYG